MRRLRLPRRADLPQREGNAKGGGDTVRLTVSLPLPARLDLTNDKTLLVASFLARQTDLMDVGNELARFLRIEFRKKAALQVLEVTPPPAIPEQTLDDLAANHEFWQMLGREHGADLIVSGSIRFDRRDASGIPGGGRGQPHHGPEDPRHTLRGAGAVHL